MNKVTLLTCKRCGAVAGKGADGSSLVVLVKGIRDGCSQSHDVEPIECAPVPSESTQDTAIRGLHRLARLHTPGEKNDVIPNNSEAAEFAAALAELRAAWGGGE